MVDNKVLKKWLDITELTDTLRDRLIRLKEQKEANLARAKRGDPGFFGLTQPGFAGRTVKVSQQEIEKASADLKVLISEIDGILNALL